MNKFLHHLDIIKCDHGGFADLSSVLERNTEIESDLRVVTDDDLLHRVKVYRCTQKCSTIVSIQQGLAKDVEVKGGAIPILGNLVATTDKGCTATADKSLKAQTAFEENLDARQNTKYLDSKNIPTIGQGFNLVKEGARGQIEGLGLNYDKVLAGTQSITDDQIDQLFAQDSASAQSSVKGYITNFDSLTETQQKALTDLSFNMPNLGGWPKFVGYMKASKFDKAADELGLGTDGKSPSKWVNDVGAVRSKRIMAQIRGGDEVYGTPK